MRTTCCLRRLRAGDEQRWTQTSCLLPMKRTRTTSTRTVLPKLETGEICPHPDRAASVGMAAAKASGGGTSDSETVSSGCCSSSRRRLRRHRTSIGAKDYHDRDRRALPPYPCPAPQTDMLTLPPSSWCFACRCVETAKASGGGTSDSETVSSGCCSSSRRRLRRHRTTSTRTVLPKLETGEICPHPDRAASVGMAAAVLRLHATKSRRAARRSAVSRRRRRAAAVPRTRRPFPPAAVVVL
jgi:hypothetical protein